MPGKNYYKTIGVSKSASPEEIKKAYRKLALKYHPDQNKGDKTAEAKFKDISEAYAVLNDPEKKKQYDMFGAEGFQKRYSQEDIFRDFDIGSIFKEFGFRGGGRGQNIFSQMFGGTGQTNSRNSGQPFSSSYNNFNGPSQGIKGRDLIYELSLTLEESAATTTKDIAFQVGGKQERVSVKVPAGISSGKKLRLAGKGQPGTHGGSNGDLYIQIKILDHPLFKKEGADLFLTKEIRFSEAILGTEIEVKTIDGKTLKVKIPAGTQTNARFRLKGKGMAHMNGNGRGDTYVQVIIAVPKKLTKKQKELAKQLSENEL